MYNIIKNRKKRDALKFFNIFKISPNFIFSLILLKACEVRP